MFTLRQAIPQSVNMSDSNEEPKVEPILFQNYEGLLYVLCIPGIMIIGTFIVVLFRSVIWKKIKSRTYELKSKDMDLEKNYVVENHSNLIIKSVTQQNNTTLQNIESGIPYQLHV